MAGMPVADDAFGIRCTLSDAQKRQESAQNDCMCIDIPSALYK